MPDADRPVTLDCKLLEKPTALGPPLRRHLYRDLGYTSIWHLATEDLGFSGTRTAQYIWLTQMVERLPRLKQAVATGEVAWTKARDLGKVATPRSEATWVERAKTRSRRQLRADVKAARHRCATRGRGHARFLQVHHCVPRARGGPSTLGNLVTCATCHRRQHDRR